jgi:hypothetical protein
MARSDLLLQADIGVSGNWHPHCGNAGCQSLAVRAEMKRHQISKVKVRDRTAPCRMARKLE